MAGDSRTIQDLGQLPAGDFRVESINLIGAHSLDPADLAKLSPLQHLKELHLPGPIGSRNTAGGANFDGGNVSPEMRHLVVDIYARTDHLQLSLSRPDPACGRRAERDR